MRRPVLRWVLTPPPRRAAARTLPLVKLNPAARTLPLVKLNPAARTLPLVELNPAARTLPLVELHKGKQVRDPRPTPPLKLAGHVDERIRCVATLRSAEEPRCLRTTPRTLRPASLIRRFP